MGRPERVDPQEAFRKGLREEVEAPLRGDGLAETANALGPGELIVLATDRLPGLAEPAAAYETGRTLRLIAQLFDQAKAPARIVEQFRDNLAAAVMAQNMRHRRASWGAPDTIEMFLEMYRCVVNPEEKEMEAMRRHILARARAPIASPRSQAPSEPFNHEPSGGDVDQKRLSAARNASASGRRGNWPLMISPGETGRP